MNSKTTVLLVTALALSCVVQAQTPPPAAPATPPATPAATPATAPAPAPSAGLVNDALRDWSDTFNAFDVGGQVRGRFEYKSGYAVPGTPGASDFSDNSPDNAYWLLRTKLHLGWKPTSWLNAYAEGRDSQSWEDKRSPVPDEDVLDLHQAYLGLGNAREFPVTAKIGRQELSYGDERLVGAFDWNNIGRVFDAGKLRYDSEPVSVDLFSGRVVIPQDEVFNESNDYDWFSGVYASTRTLVPKQETQLYFLARNVGRSSPTAFQGDSPALVPPASARDIYTLGARVKSLPGQLAGWDYDAELAGQLGNFYDAAQDERLEQQAWAAHLGGGYTFEQTAWKPRVGLEYNFSSGDSDPGDDTHETFDNLFPTNHKYYGYMDFVSWQNIHQMGLRTSARPLKGLTLSADFHAFWLADTSDFFYGVSGAARNAGGYGLQPNNGSFVGTEIDLVASYQIRPYAAAQVGYGHFFRGDYIKDTLTSDGSQDADWIYAQLHLNF